MTVDRSFFYGNGNWFLLSDKGLKVILSNNATSFKSSSILSAICPDDSHFNQFHHGPQKFQVLLARLQSERERSNLESFFSGSGSWFLLPEGRVEHTLPYNSTNLIKCSPLL